MTLQKAFEDYMSIALELATTVYKYDQCFSELSNQELKEQIFHEKISDEEKEKIDKDITKLEIQIHDLYVRFLNQTNIIKTAASKEEYINSKVINVSNKKHIGALTLYLTIQIIFEDLKEAHPDYSFENVIDFSDMERQKLKLNKAIDDFNFRLLDSKIKLWTVDECTTEAKEIIARVE